MITVGLAVCVASKYEITDKQLNCYQSRQLTFVGYLHYQITTFRLDGKFLNILGMLQTK